MEALQFILHRLALLYSKRFLYTPQYVVLQVQWSNTRTLK